MKSGEQSILTLCVLYVAVYAVLLMSCIGQISAGLLLSATGLLAVAIFLIAYCITDQRVGERQDTVKSRA